MSDTPEPPPVEPKNARPSPQFSLASLLGVMALVAVLSTLGATAPWLLWQLLRILLDAALVGYGVFIALGAWLATERRRIFCIGALLGLTMVVWTGFGFTSALHLDSQTPWGGAGWLVVGTTSLRSLERIVLSLFGGWVALRAAAFWQSDDSTNG